MADHLADYFGLIVLALSALGIAGVFLWVYSPPR
jgi:hypothetical protein